MIPSRKKFAGWDILWKKRKEVLRMAAISVNTEQFSQMLAGEKPLLADFWAPWCVHCRRLQAAFDQVARENEDSVLAVKINIDEEGKLANSQKIEVIPTLVLYQGGKRMASIVNPGSKAEIDGFLREALGER